MNENMLRIYSYANDRRTSYLQQGYIAQNNKMLHKKNTKSHNLSTERSAQTQNDFLLLWRATHIGFVSFYSARISFLLSQIFHHLPASFVTLSGAYTNSTNNDYAVCCAALMPFRRAVRASCISVAHFVLHLQSIAHPHHFTWTHER